MGGLHNGWLDQGGLGVLDGKSILCFEEWGWHYLRRCMVDSESLSLGRGLVPVSMTQEGVDEPEGLRRGGMDRVG